MISLQQRIQATLGFSNICVNKEWRLYWLGTFLGYPRQAWEFQIMTVEGPRTAVISVAYEAQTGFKISLSGNISQEVFDSEEELTTLLCDLRNMLKSIFDGKNLQQREAA